MTTGQDGGKFVSLTHRPPLPARNAPGRDDKKGKNQGKMDRRSRKKSSSAGSEKMERVGGR